MSITDNIYLLNYVNIVSSIYERKYIRFKYEDGLEYLLGIERLDVDSDTIQKIYGFAMDDTFNVKDFSKGIEITKIKDSSIEEFLYFKNEESEKLLEFLYDSKIVISAPFRNDKSGLNILEYFKYCYNLGENKSNKIEKNILLNKFNIDDKKKEGKILYYTLSEEQIETLDKKFEIKRNNRIFINLIAVTDSKKSDVLVYKQGYFDNSKKRIVLENEEIYTKKYVEEDFGYSYKFSEYIGKQEINFEDINKKINDYFDNLYPNGDTSTREIKKRKLDTTPFFFRFDRKMGVNLNEEYKKIKSIVIDNKLNIPLKFFMGIDPKRKEEKIKFIPCIGRDINKFQCSVISHAMTDTVSCIKGPPGTGKTSTIIDIILTYYNKYRNGKKILITSHDNLPLDEILKKLRELKYKDKQIPLPCFRITNKENFESTLRYIEELKIIYTENKIDKNTCTKIIEEIKTDLKDEIKITGVKDIKNFQNFFLERLYYSSFYLLDELFTNTKYKDFLNINDYDNFINYIKIDENLKNILNVFPILITTTLSARHLLDIKNKEMYFDLCIMDEANRCDMFTALIPISMSKRIALVGDPMQLEPIIRLNDKDNELLKKIFGIDSDYDYKCNSIYKAFAKNQEIEETLLQYHYRCTQDIIGFSKEHFYENKLQVKTENQEYSSLYYIPVESHIVEIKNTSNLEIEVIKNLLRELKQDIKDGSNIGIITPFKKQCDLIKESLNLESKHEDRIKCGTIHSFQGAERDIIIISLSLTGSTREDSYEWLVKNRQIINVASTRAKKKVYLIACEEVLNVLHENLSEKLRNDDIVFLYFNYIKEKSVQKEYTFSFAKNCTKQSLSEKQFESTLKYIISIINPKISINEEYSIRRHVDGSQEFYVDFVLEDEGKKIAIEINGPDHYNNEEKQKRDETVNKILDAAGIPLLSYKNEEVLNYNKIIKDIKQYFDTFDINDIYGDSNGTI